MTSTTAKTATRKAINQAREGRARKRKLRIEGSTKPNLPLDKPNANELAQKKAALAAKKAKA